MAKPKSISLVPHNMSSNFSSRDMTDSGSLGNVEVEPGSVRTCIWKQMVNTSPFPTKRSQEWKPERTQKESSWKQEQGSEASHSTCYRQLEQCASTPKNQMRKRTWYRAEPDAALRGKSFPELAEEIGNHGRINTRRTGRNEIDMGIIHVIVKESSHPSWTKLY